MTQLRQRMLEELQRRNFARETIRGYIRSVRDFAACLHTPPDQLGPDELRQFQLHMLGDRKLSAGTVRNGMAALRFFFKKTLKRHDPDFDDMGVARRPKKLPVVLSPQEVTQLIEAARNIRNRTILRLDPKCPGLAPAHHPATLPGHFRYRSTVIQPEQTDR